MKKFFSLVAIATVAATMFTSCSKNDDPVPGPTKAKLTLSVDNKAIAKDAEGTFTVTSDINAPEAIVVSVSSSSAATLTVDPASVTIAKGTKTITGKFKGVADGKATITIAAAGVTLTVPSVEITVGEAGPDLENLLECNADNAWSDMYFANEDSFGFTLWFNNTVLLENAGCDYYGTDLALTAAEKGADITTLTMTQNLEHILMGTNKSEGYDKLPDFSKIGKAQYVVFCVTDGYTEPLFDTEGVITNPQDFSHDKPQIKGWALVTSDGGDNVILHAIKFPATKVGE